MIITVSMHVCKTFCDLSMSIAAYIIITPMFINVVARGIHNYSDTSESFAMLGGN